MGGIFLVKGTALCVLNLFAKSTLSVTLLLYFTSTK